MMWHYGEVDSLHVERNLLRNKTCDQLYGKDASQEVSVGEKVSSQHTPSPCI
jgi:hypothetical protein